MAQNWRRRGKFEEVKFIFPNAPTMPITVVRLFQLISIDQQEHTDLGILAELRYGYASLVRYCKATGDSFFPLPMATDNIGHARNRMTDYKPDVCRPISMISSPIKTNLGSCAREPISRNSLMMKSNLRPSLLQGCFSVASLKAVPWHYLQA